MVNSRIENENEAVQSRDANTKTYYCKAQAVKIYQVLA